MGELLTRRALMLPGEVTPREWDYEWDASDGLPTANGFTRTTTSTATQTLEDGYVSIYTGKHTTAQNTYTYGHTYSTGVFETTVRLNSTNEKILISFGNGTYGIGVRMQHNTSYQGVYLGTAVTTKLATITTATDYTIKLVLKGSTADVYLDDVLISADVDVTSMTECSNVHIQFATTNSSAKYYRLYSIKMKQNRTE